jgi:hypothetical protein
MAETQSYHPKKGARYERTGGQSRVIVIAPHGVEYSLEPSSAEHWAHLILAAVRDAEKARLREFCDG